VRRSTGALALALCVALAPLAAAARAVTYSVQPSDTAESIAADYYGNRSLAHIVLEVNGLERGARLRPGTKLRIPTAFRYRVKRGETLEGLAQRFCEDRRRAPVLAQILGLRPGDKLREGQELMVPFNVPHRTDKPESLASIAREFYGDPGKAKLLADYNFRSSPLVGKGERVLVPISHVKIRAVYLQPAPTPPQAPSASPGQATPPPVDPNLPTVAAASEREAQRREVELAARVGGLLVEAEKAYKDGNYAEVSANLDKLLSEEDPSEVQLAEIFRLKAFSYVALGMDDLAERAFREVLARRPALQLDEASVSPKIRAALDRAKKAMQ
jgi:LysM repeat protein